MTLDLTCPTCGELCARTATKCDCGARLLPTKHDIDTLNAAWTCPNCLRTWRDPFCTECGANLIREPMEVGNVEALAEP